VPKRCSTSSSLIFLIFFGSASKADERKKKRKKEKKKEKVNFYATFNVRDDVVVSNNKVLCVRFCLRYT